jgi:hypothetical protein
MDINNENNQVKPDKSSSRGKIISRLIYGSYLLVAVAIWFTNLPLYETMFRFWVVTYLVLLFNLFFDENPPKVLNINDWFNNAEADKYYEEYMDNVITILNITMKSIKFIERKDYNDKYKEEYEHNLKVVRVSYERLKRVKVPAKYKNTQENILRDIENFIQDYEEFFRIENGNND